MAQLNCIDMSKWGGAFSAEEARCAISKGIKKVIVGTGNPAVGGAGEWARRQASSWINNGGQYLDAYIYLYMKGSPRTQIKNALDTMRDLPIGTFWLDAEDQESPDINIDKRHDFLWTCINSIEEEADFYGFPIEQRVGIYTGAWWWKPMMGNSKEFKDFPLWDSNYPLGAGESNVFILPWQNRAYGGWSAPEIHQFTNTTIFCGQSVDLNWDTKLVGPEDNEVALEDRLILLEKICGVHGIDINHDGIVDLTGEEAIKKLAEMGASLPLAISNLSRSVNEHLNNHPGFTGGKLAEGDYHIKPL